MATSSRDKRYKSEQSEFGRSQFVPGRPSPQALPQCPTTRSPFLYRTTNMGLKIFAFDYIARSSSLSAFRTWVGVDKPSTVLTL